MKKLTIAVVLLLFVVVPSIFAQEIDLDATFENNVLRFNYPEGWEVWETDEVIDLSITDNGANGFGIIDFAFIYANAIEDQNGLDFVNLNAVDAMTEVAELFDLETDYIHVIETELNTIASLEIEDEFNYQIISVIENENRLIFASIAGEMEQISLLKELFFQILATVELIDAEESAIEIELTLSDTRPDVELTQTHESENSEVIFDYPSNWQVDDRGNYIEIIPMEGMFENTSFELINISVFENVPGMDISGLDAQETISEIVFGINASMIDIDEEIPVVEIGNNIIAYNLRPTPDGTSEIMFAAIEHNGEIIIVRLVSLNDDIEATLDIFFAIAETIELSG